MTSVRGLLEEVVPWPTVRFAGVRVPRPPGGRVPWPTVADSKSHYEAALLDAIRETVSIGDDVVIAGGEYGVSSVVAANQAGHSGTVTCFEAARDVAERAEETVTLNGVGHRVNVRNRVVETEGLTRGEDVGRPIRLDRVDSPDVLVVDVDGAELDLVRALSSSRLSPRAVVVEHHAVPGGSDYNPGRVVSAVEEAGYQIVAVHTRKIPPRFGGQETVLIGRQSR
ncbi:Methyltransferase FkbM domain-containing protein [Halogeometricum rufum]|uniref:Methyltransferase FkbM domain-containing protein n=1 Tax=Halogeometricum rufum TaxID=553469 RepID=A0A1I6G281_9EURY|nr:FkbM family methyltransferase [Halogeometricum rufum]SFR36323.1 Methyltransferase FkbM domain-containing protein [Halogeometricum rufum]